MINRDEIMRELLQAGVEPPDWLEEWLADSENGTADPFVFLPSPQGPVPVLFWTDELNEAVARLLSDKS